MVQTDSEKEIAEKNVSNAKAKLAVYEEQLAELSRDVTLLKQENASKAHKIEELVVKTLLLDNTEKDLQNWKNKYSALQRTQGQDVESLKSKHENTLKNKVSFNNNKTHVMTD